MRHQSKILGVCAGMALFFAFLHLYPVSPKGEETRLPEHVSAEAEKPANTEVTFTTLDSGGNAPGSKNRKNYAIYTQEEFESFWKIAHGDSKGAPVVDFKKHYVIVVFAGEKAGATGIEVSKINDAGTARNLEVTLKIPEGECKKKPSGSPYQFVLVPFGNEASFSHTDVTKSVECPA